MSHLQWVIPHIIRHDSIDLHAIVQESHAALSVGLHYSYIFNPVIEEGSLLGSYYALETSSLGFLGIVIFI